MALMVKLSRRVDAGNGSAQETRRVGLPCLPLVGMVVRYPGGRAIVRELEVADGDTEIIAGRMEIAT